MNASGRADVLLLESMVGAADAAPAFTTYRARSSAKGLRAPPISASGWIKALLRSSRPQAGA